MNYVFRITSLASLCFLFNSLGAQTKSKSTTRIIEIQNGDTIRNETIITDSEPDNDPQNKNGNNKRGNYSYNYNSGGNFNSSDIEKEIEKAMKEMEKGLKELENINLNIDLSDLGKGMDGFMNELEKLTDITIDTKTRNRFGKKSTEITIKGPKGNNRVIIIDKNGNVKSHKEFDKKKAKEYEKKQKQSEQEKAIQQQKKIEIKKEIEREVEKELKKKETENGSRAPRFMMSTEDNKVYTFEIETASDSEVEIEIKNKEEKLLLKEIEPRGRKFEKQIDLGKFGPGTYSIKLTQDGKEISSHTIVVGG